VAEREQHRELLPLADRHREHAAVERNLPLLKHTRDERLVPTRVERSRDRHLLPGRQSAEQLVLLCHETDPVFGGLLKLEAALAEDRNGARRGRAEAEQHLEQRGLARAVAAEEPDDVARCDRGRHVAERRLLAEPFAEVADRDDWLNHRRPPTSR
jgi:hypothetical protein